MMALDGALIAGYAKAAPDTLARLLTRADRATTREALSQLDSETLAHLLTHAESRLVRRVLALLETDRRVELARELAESPHGVVTLRQLTPGERMATLTALPAAVAARLERLVALPPESAGAWCSTEMVTAAPEERLRDVLGRLAREEDERIPGIWVVDSAGQYAGLIGAWQALQTPPAARVAAVAKIGASITEDTPLGSALEHYDESCPEGLAVLDHQRQLVGVLTQKAMRDALHRIRREGSNAPTPVAGALLASWAGLLQTLTTGRGTS